MHATQSYMHTYVTIYCAIKRNMRHTQSLGKIIYLIDRLLSNLETLGSTWHDTSF